MFRAAGLGQQYATLSSATNRYSFVDRSVYGSKIISKPILCQKMLGQVSVSLEAWQDTGEYGEGQFSSWLPTELTRSLVNENPTSC